VTGRTASVLVIGAGVIGLTSALVLARRGHRVRIWARELSPTTTSGAAGALWLPFLAEPAHLVTRWSAASLEEYRRLAATDPGSGCFEIRAELYFDDRPGDPAWSALVGSYRSGPVTGARAARYRHRQSADLPFIDVRYYLPFLSARLHELGVPIERRPVGSLDEAFAAAPVVVNCTGIGSARLAADTGVYPVRGQTVRIRGGRDADRPPVALIDEQYLDRLTFVFPRVEDTVLGGTVQRGDWRLEPDPGDTDAIIARCRELAPELGDIEVLGVAVGLRPARPEVRVERVARAPGQMLIHNYGHGGSGYTLSWGCARDVADLIDSDDRRGRAPDPEDREHRYRALRR